MPDAFLSLMFGIGIGFTRPAFNKHQLLTAACLSISCRLGLGFRLEGDMVFFRHLTIARAPRREVVYLTLPVTDDHTGQSCTICARRNLSGISTRGE